MRAITPTTETAQLALDTVHRKMTQGIPSWMLHIMEHSHIERMAGINPGGYVRDPVNTYIACQRAAGVCMIDQFIPENPLTMGDTGYEDAELGATTGAEETVLDDIRIDSPESVVEHMERIVFPALRAAMDSFDEDARVREIIEQERSIQERIGPAFLKSGYAFISIPGLAYGTYGYVPYFAAYGLYPDVIEKHFSLQADLAAINNRAAARAYREAHLPPLYRLDHDMADSRGLLVNPETLDQLWFPHFARALEPVLETDVRLIWHCDGNLMDMVPRLLDVGIAGFQGFQYEDGMDYERICRMKTRDGESLTIVGGVSVTRTLPLGTPQDVKREMEWLVAHGPPVGFFLGASSSIAPATPWANIAMLSEGVRYYRTHGRS
jgi:hypothetical protein